MVWGCDNEHTDFLVLTELNILVREYRQYRSKNVTYIACQMLISAKGKINQERETGGAHREDGIRLSFHLG